MSLTRINELEAADGAVESLHTFLTELLDYLKASEGCLGAELLVSEEKSGRFVVIERWATKEAHSASLAAYSPDAMAKARPLIGGIPKGEFFR